MEELRSVMEHYSNFKIDYEKLNIFKTRKRKKSYSYECDNILTFDIEVSSAWMDDNGELIPYRENEDEEFWNSKQAYALPYIWQFSFDENVYYGRELKDFIHILNKLPKQVHFIIYTHNFSYEFEFLSNILTWESVFAREAHSPMYAVPLEYPDIEIRCSYFLTRKSLARWGGELGIPKLVGDLDYVTLRTPLTELTEKELGYCKRDCVITYEGIKEYRKKYDHVFNIPLTQTGEVRRVIKKKMTKNPTTRNWMISLIPKSARMYSIMKKTFMGGYTHANFTLAGRVINPYEDTYGKQEVGYAYDFASAYPSVMCCEKFPVKPFTRCYFDINMMDTYAYMMLVKMTNVRANKRNHYIPFEKCKEFPMKNVTKDNGRIIDADECSMWMTEQDFDIINKSYDFEYEVIECYRSRKWYLPKELVEYVFELYEAKTKYKGVDEMKEEYKTSKEFVNSLFGMCVTDPIQDSINYEDGHWTKILATFDDVEEYLEDLRTNNKGRTFLAYQFGLWITAYARHNLWSCLLQYDEDVIYCDTDSIKMRVKGDFQWFNDEIQRKLEESCEFHGIDKAMIAPEDKFGVKHPLGHFDAEDEWTEFITLGAKRYCYRSAVDGKLHMTVSGMSKQAVIVLRDDINNFNTDLVYDKDYFANFKRDCENGDYWFEEHEGMTFDEICKKFKISDGTKNMHQYTTQGAVTWNNGKYDEYRTDPKYDKYGIVIRPTSYSMSMTDEYLMLIALGEMDNRLQCMKG